MAGNHLEVGVTNSCTSEGMDEYLEITSLAYDGGEVIDQLTDVNGNGWIDLDDFEQDAEGGLDSLSLQDLNSNHSFSLEVRLHETTPNEYQGQSCTSLFLFTLNQDASQ